MRALPLLLLLSLLCCRQPDPHDLEIERRRLLREATAWLWAQQADDGGWHSETHGLLKEGQAWTPYVYEALLAAPESIYRPSSAQLERAAFFLIDHLDSLGAMGRSQPVVLEYPVYATAYTLRALGTTPVAITPSLSVRMRDYLLGRQFTEARGISIDHPAYGAWGFGETNLPHGEVGHVDLSHTRRVLEALRASRLEADHPAWEKALAFLGGVQKVGTPNFDGGFCASTYTLGANKADDADHQCRSYASATADGALALLAAGLPATDERVRAAREWLLAHPRWDYPEGIPPGQPGDWGQVLFYYHLAVRAQAYQALGIENGWQAELIPLLTERQRPDGSFANPAGAPNKEDDPLLATALVVRALIAAR